MIEKFCNNHSTMSGFSVIRYAAIEGHVSIIEKIAMVIGRKRWKKSLAERLTHLI